MDRQKIKAEAKQQIDSLFNQLEAMEKRRDRVKEDLKNAFDEQLVSLKLRRTELESTFRQWADTRQESWDEAKGKFQESAQSFGRGVSKLATMLK